MSSEYTPTLEEVRENYGWNGHDSYIESNREASKAQFDRFIKQYRAEAKAEALNEAADALTREDVPDGWGIPTYENYGNWLRARASQLKESK